MGVCSPDFPKHTALYHYLNHEQAILIVQVLHSAEHRHYSGRRGVE